MSTMNFQEIVNNPEFQSLLNDNLNILADWLMDKNAGQIYIDEARTGVVVYRTTCIGIKGGRDSGYGGGLGSCLGDGSGIGNNGANSGNGGGLGSCRGTGGGGYGL